MNADDVARYLKDNPGFFEEHAELLTQISVPNPHGGKAIALSDRQVLALRDENKALRAKMGELIQFGEENDAIGDKMHRLSVALLQAPDLAAVIAALHLNLRDDFAIPHTALRLWRDGAAGADAGAQLLEDLEVVVGEADQTERESQGEGQQRGVGRRSPGNQMGCHVAHHQRRENRHPAH